MARILLVDDDRTIRDSLELILSYEGHELVQAPDGDEALRRIGQALPELVLLDVVMPGRSGLEVLEEIQTSHPEVVVIMVTGHGDDATAIAATRKGAFDFIRKPLERDRLLVSVRNALRHSGMRREIFDRYRIVGESAALRRMLADVDRVAPTEAMVLITGENGTGKELVARRIQVLSARRDGPFVEVNCAAIPRELIESELFGHVKGSFTGADRDKTGKFEQAQHGTLFLDEVGDMGLESQAKVLRVLEQRTVERVGGSRPIRLDVRVVAATNKDLEQEMREGRFREDLYHRLNVVPIRVPPLRERIEDVPLLVEYFLEDACLRNGVRPRPRITPAAHEALKAKSWSGNVRELRNFVERLVILRPRPVMDADAIEASTGRGTESVWQEVLETSSFEEFKEKSERLFLEHKLATFHWNITRTADALGMQRSHLYKKIDRLGLRRAARGGGENGTPVA
ncbi:MAG: sigma-54-dependent Fis family transcriptional regulator [Planctomycetes bacterium]|nr:sigma-54-dependent Fis family transcriptional regulator [Planctomycetota bacterium]